MIGKFHNTLFEPLCFFVVTFLLCLQDIMAADGVGFTNESVKVDKNIVSMERSCSEVQIEEMNKSSNFKSLPSDMLVHLALFLGPRDKAYFSLVSKGVHTHVLLAYATTIPRLLHLQHGVLYVRSLKQIDPMLQKGICLPRTDEFDKSIEEYIPLSDVWRHLNLAKLNFLTSGVLQHAEGWQSFLADLALEKCRLATQYVRFDDFCFTGQKYFDDVDDLEVTLNAKGYGVVKRNPKKLKYFALVMHNKTAKELYFLGLLNGENGIQQNRKLFMCYVKCKDRMALRIYYRSLYYGLNGFKKNYEHVLQCAVLGCERAQECIIRDGYALSKFSANDVHFIKYCIKKGMKMAVRYYALILTGTSFIPVDKSVEKSEKKFLRLVKRYPQETRMALSILYYRGVENLSTMLRQLCVSFNVKGSMHKYMHFIEQQEMQTSQRLFRPKDHPKMEKLAAELEAVRREKGGEVAISYLNSPDFNIQLLQCYLGIRRFGY